MVVESYVSRYCGPFNTKFSGNDTEAWSYDNEGNWVQSVTPKSASKV